MRVGIFGGTFDPVHIGHIKMAEYAKDEFALDKIVFVPNANPPHKKDKNIEDYSHRFKMLKLAVGEKSFFSVSDYESESGKYYYSLHTMRHFREIYGKETYFIIGGDSLTTIDRWYEYETLLKENKFIVFKRNDSRGFCDAVDKYRALGAEIHVSDMEEIVVSSTDVRKDIKSAGNNGILCADVYEYIAKAGLYGGSYDTGRD